MSFSRSQLSHFPFFMNGPIYSTKMKNTLLLTYSTKILVLLLTVNKKECLTPKNPKICHPILVTLLKMLPHYSQLKREIATPSSGSSPLASYKEVHPPDYTQYYTTTNSFSKCFKLFLV